ncbi:MAG: hypothetical protein ACI4RO_00780 [Candidatus Scatosoma sp.]
MRFFSCVEKAILPYPLVACSVGGAFFAFFIACVLRKTSAYFICGGAFALVSAFAAKFCRAFSAEDVKAFCLCLFALYALLYAAFLFRLRVALKKEARRRRFEEMKLQSQYVLPERGNGYVRDKLRENALASERRRSGSRYAEFVPDGAVRGRVTDGEEFCKFSDETRANPEATSRESEEARVELSHARGLINRLKKYSLSLSDRLETQRLEQKISACSGAERLTAEQIRTLSDCFSALLKLTAKYVG